MSSKEREIAAFLQAIRVRFELECLLCVFEFKETGKVQSVHLGMDLESVPDSLRSVADDVEDIIKARGKTKAVDQLPPSPPSRSKH